MNKNKIIIISILILIVTIRTLAQGIDTSDSTAKKDDKYKVHVSGLIQVHFLNKFNTNGDSIVDPCGFRILRARLKATGKINKFISYELMIDPRAPEQGGILRDAYLEFRLSKNQSLRVGQQKTQFGYDNTESITREYFVNRAEVSDDLSRGYNLRDIGLGLLGYIKLNDYYRLEDAITFTNGSKMNVAGPFDFSDTKNLFGRIGIRYKKEDFKLCLGFSAGRGGIMDYGDDPISSLDDFFIKFKRFGTDLEVYQKWMFIASEFVMGTDMVNDTIENRYGYYLTLVGKTKWKAGPIFRFDALDDEFNRPTVGLYYGLPEDKFRIFINYEFRGNIKDIPTGHDDRLYIQAQVRF